MREKIKKLIGIGIALHDAQVDTEKSEEILEAVIEVSGVEDIKAGK